MVSGMAGCGGGDAGAGGTPSVSGGASVTPSVTPTPTPSEDPLFTEAKAVHLKYVEEMLKLERAGGAQELPAGMKILVAGEFESVLGRLYAEFQAKGLKATPSSKATIGSEWVIPKTKGHAVALGSCVDFRGVAYTGPGIDGVSQGMWRRDELQFDVDGDTVVIVDGSSKQVKTCDSPER
jgi:hypothetical protein